MGVMDACLLIWRAAGLWVSAVLFLLPLRRRSSFGLRLGLGLAVGLAVRTLPAFFAPDNPATLWAYFLFSYLLHGYSGLGWMYLRRVLPVVLLSAVVTAVPRWLTRRIAARFVYEE